MKTTCLALTIWAAAAMPLTFAADLIIELRDVHGKPVADAVVSVTSQKAGTGSERHAAPATKVIDQRGEVFEPYLEIFHPGDRVVFRNSDSTRHHVYSFSETKAFEFVLTSGQSSTPLVLDMPGVIAAGCNIHDSMIAYLYVSDAPWLGRSGTDGHVRIEGLAAGAYHVAVWHPLQRPGNVQERQQITIDPVVTAVNAAFELSLLPDPRRAPDRERASY